MPQFDVYWSPEGRKIITVEARDARAAKRKAPMPYRKFLGEIYVTEVSPREFIPVTFDQFKAGKCTSYTGGAAWYSLPAFPSEHIVFACTPVEVRAYFESNPTGSVVGERVKAKV